MQVALSSHGALPDRWKRELERPTLRRSRRPPSAFLVLLTLGPHLAMPPRGSPGKGKTKLSTDMTPLALPALLKLLTTSGPRPPHLDMRQAMQAASKLVPKGYTSEGKLRLLTGADLAQLGIADDDLRKALLVVISGKGSSAASAKGKGAAGDGAAAGDPGEVRRKRARDSDLDKPLPSRAPKGLPIDEDFQFDEIEAEEVRPRLPLPCTVTLLTLPLDCPQALLKKFCLTNRAPVMTAWACVVAERLGFRRQEALSIGASRLTLVQLTAERRADLGASDPAAHVFTDLNATSKGVSLGLMSADALKVEVGPSQPFVEILGRKVRPVEPPAKPERLAADPDHGARAGPRPLDAERRVARHLEGPRRRSGQGVLVHAQRVQAAARRSRRCVHSSSSRALVRSSRLTLLSQARCASSPTASRPQSSTSRCVCFLALVRCDVR